MGEIGEAAEILKVTIEGAEVAFKLMGTGVKGIRALAGLIKYLIDRDKLEGKTSMIKLLRQGSDLQVFKFDEDQIKTFERYAKRYGILYTKLPDINKEDGMTEILFHTDSLPRVLALQEKMKVGRVTSLEEYISNGKKEEIDKIIDSLDEKNVKDLAEELTPEQRAELGKVKDEMDVDALSRDESKVGITISEKLVYNETEDRFRTRIPGQRDEFLELKPQDVKVINDGKTRLTFLDKDKEYDILNSKGEAVRKMTGKALYDRSYDPVSADTIERTVWKEKQAGRTGARKAGAAPKVPKTRGR